jgi:formate hydrogenlyase subunit 3/multisubunit Na+/H+ antiporter MnhD subunit
LNSSYVKKLVLALLARALAPKIQEESKIKAIGGIAVLSTFVFMVLIMIWFASPQASPWFKESLSSIFNTSGWTDYQVAVYSELLQTMDTVVGLVVFFIGLYAGSMLRKPSAKTKE